MLTLKNKADIYDLLKLGFKENEKIPLATLALYLNSKKFSYQEFGYKKLKSLLEDLQFLSFETDKKNPQIVYVTLHSFLDEKNSESVKQIRFHPKDKKKITQLLLNQFTLGKSYPMNQVTAFLSKNNIQPEAYGFDSYRSLLGSFKDILTIEKNRKEIIHFLSLKGKTTKEKKTDSLPVPKKDCFYVPDNLLLSIKEFSDLGLDDNAILNLLLKDYTKAYQKKDFKEKEDAFIFPLSFTSKDKEPLIASIKKAGKGASYSYYLNFVGSDKEKAKDVLNDTIYFDNFDKSMEQLASLARKEKWCYRNSKDKYIILKIYIQYTFYQIISQNKLCIDETSSFATFNTGLKTQDYEDIYGIMIFNKNNAIRQKYIFQGFTVSASQGLGKIIVEHFNPLPKKATYIHSKEELIFDSSADIHTDYRHIILDNLDRFPLSFLKAMVLPFKDEKRIVDSLEKEKSSFNKAKSFEKLENLVSKNDTLFTLLTVSLEASIKKAIRMVSYDYRNALPSFFPTRNVMSLMLPLEFTNNDEVEALLLIEKTPSGNYQGQTILTLKQCYVNSRLISPLENSFLDPSKIED